MNRGGILIRLMTSEVRTILLFHPFLGFRSKGLGRTGRIQKRNAQERAEKRKKAKRSGTETSSEMDENARKAHTKRQLFCIAQY